MITAYMNKNMLQYLEVNPLFMVTGSLIPVIILNIIIIGLVYWLYIGRWRTPFLRYALSNFFVWVCFARIFAIRSNILAYLSPPSLEVAQSITDSYKIAVATNHVLLYFCIPYLICLLTYVFFRLDHRIRMDDEKI